MLTWGIVSIAVFTGAIIWKESSWPDDELPNCIALLGIVSFLAAMASLAVRAVNQ